MKGKERVIFFIIFLNLLNLYLFNHETSASSLFISLYDAKNNISSDPQEGIDSIVKRVYQSPNLTEKEPIFTFREHSDKVTSVTFSPDGGFIASGSYDRSLLEWDLRTRNRDIVREATSDEILSIDYSPNQQLIAYAGDESCSAVELISGNEILLSDEASYSVKFSPDRRILAIGQNNSINLYNITSLRSIDTLFQSDQKIYALDFSPDGKYLASGGRGGGLINIWNVANGDLVRSLPGHTDDVHSIVFSPDGKSIASGSNDKTIKIWNASNGNVIREISFNDWVNCIAFSPDGSILASGDFNGYIRLWNMTSREEIQSFTAHEIAVASLDFSPDGSMLVSGGFDTRVKVWSLTFGRTIVDFASLADKVNSIAYQPDGSLFAAGTSFKRLHVWNLTSGEELPTLLLSRGDIKALTFSPTGKLLVSAGSSEEIIVWNVSDNQKLFSLAGNLSNINTIDFSPNGSLLASGGEDGRLIIWDMVTRVEKSQIKMNGPLKSLHFLTGGNNVLLLNDTEVLSLNLNTLEVTNYEQEIDDQDYNATCLGLSENEAMVAVGDTVGKVHLHNITGERIVTLVGATGGHLDRVNSIAFFPLDETILVSADDYGIIIIWNTTIAIEPPANGISDTKIRKYFGHKSRINSVIYSPDGNWIVSCGDDHHIKFWPFNPSPSDIDGDGMSDLVELTPYTGLNPINYWDRFWDMDNNGIGDGLLNYMEIYLKTDIRHDDTDHDEMDDRWEFLNGLNYSVSDASSDLDEDGMTNLYEYQTMLDPTLDDATADKDQDGMLNIWEHEFRFNANDASDAAQDADGDWVNNLDEIKAGTNPNDFWSIPVFSLSVIHLGFGGIIIIISIGILFIYRERHRKNIITRLRAPDYATALKIQKLGYSNHSVLLEAEQEVLEILKEANDLYYRGELTKSLHRHERALSLAENLANDGLIARCVLKTAYVQKKDHTLNVDSSILKRFPKFPFRSDEIKAYQIMIQALLAEIERNWGTAEKHWQKALNLTELPIEYQFMGKGALIASQIREWYNDPSSTPVEEIASILENWQKECDENQQYELICEAYLSRARVALVTLNVDTVDFWLNRCLTLAKELKLVIIQKYAENEIKIFTDYKKQINALIASEKTPTLEQKQILLNEYIKKARRTLEISREIYTEY